MERGEMEVRRPLEKGDGGKASLGERGGKASLGERGGVPWREGRWR